MSLATRFQQIAADRRAEVEAAAQDAAAEAAQQADSIAESMIARWANLPRSGDDSFPRPVR